jgi:outer membrane lipoprotein-sorting protein
MARAFRNLAVPPCLAMLCLAILPLCGCFVQRRVVPPPAHVQNRPLLTATKEELIERVRKTFDPIQSFSMRADMAPSVGSILGGEITDYATIRGDLLFRRPDQIRVIGLDPVIHSTTVFDMASTGADFRVSIPSKSRFIEGDNNAPPSSKSKLENLRPVAFLNSLIMVAPDPESTLFEDDTDESKAVYILFVVRRDGAALQLVRSIYFDRYSLEINRQKTFDPSGEILSETKYSNWKPYNGLSFPSLIDIRRPRDGYEVTLTLIDMNINPAEVTPDKFVLEQPPGTQVTRLK